jgi:hypothetical protein
MSLGYLYIFFHNIIKYMNENKNNNDEGLCYYLQKNGYEIVGEPIIF